MSGLGMDAYTLHLLGMAVEVTDGRISIRRFKDRWEVWSPRATVPFALVGPTLADALAALLRDLGVEVPERPTAEEVETLYDRGTVRSGTQMADLFIWEYARNRLAVLALLEEGA